MYQVDGDVILMDNPFFLIDSKLFPGSSGSVVLTKPQYVAVIDGNLMYNKEGSYVFLGIYSGEPIRQNAPIELEDMTIIKKDSYNVGNVWYSTLNVEILCCTAIDFFLFFYP